MEIDRRVPATDRAIFGVEDEKRRGGCAVFRNDKTGGPLNTVPVGVDVSVLPEGGGMVTIKGIGVPSPL